jgi:hypothetical protein
MARQTTWTTPYSPAALFVSGLGNGGDENESGDKPDMLEKGVRRDESCVTFHRPEIVGDEHGNRRENAERASAQPDEATRNYQG